MIPIFFKFFFSTMVAIILSQADAGKPANSVDFKLINLSGKPIEVFWVDTFSPEERLVTQSKKPIRNNTDIVIHSYASHKFTVRFLKHIEFSEANFTKLAKDEVIKVKFDREHQRLVLEQATKFNEGVTLLREATASCEAQFPNDRTLRHQCIANQTLEYAQEFTEARDTMDQYRDALSEKVRNYTCADATMETTESVRSYEYFFLGKPYIVDILFESDAAKIWMVEDFVTENECRHFIQKAKPQLSRATVAGEDGQSIISQHRKAQQAAYDFPVTNFRNDPQWPLYERIIHLVNHHAHYNLQPEGQEGFTVIQYNPSDEYMPHCDGSCDGQPFRRYGRVATAVLYCELPTAGGATTFTNADIHVNVKRPGTAVFFTYKNPKTGTTDEKLTEHSGCPVLEGEKWIATAWLREGVSAEEPSEKYDPDGVPVFQDDNTAEEVSEVRDDEEEYIERDEL